MAIPPPSRFVTRTVYRVNSPGRRVAPSRLSLSVMALGVVSTTKLTTWSFRVAPALPNSLVADAASMLSPSSGSCGVSAGSVTDTAKAPPPAVVTVVVVTTPPPEVKPASGVWSSSAVLVSRWKVSPRARPVRPVPSLSASRPVTSLVDPAGASWGLVLSQVIAACPAFTVSTREEAMAPSVEMGSAVSEANSS